MVDEKITIAELGAYTNNSPNKEGIKKVVKAINDGLSPDLSDYYTKEETDGAIETAISEIDFDLKDFTLVESGFDELVTDGKLNCDVYVIDNSIVQSMFLFPKGIFVNEMVTFSNFAISSSNYGHIYSYAVPVGVITKSTGTTYTNNYSKDIKLSDPIGSGKEQYIDITMSWNSSRTYNSTNNKVYKRD